MAYEVEWGLTEVNQTSLFSSSSIPLILSSEILDWQIAESMGYIVKPKFKS